MQESNAQHAAERRQLEAKLDETRQQLDAENKALGSIDPRGARPALIIMSDDMYENNRLGQIQDGCSTNDRRI